MAALTFDHVTYTYPGGERPALDGISLEVEPGELVLLLGESGCGKSTLLRAAVGLVPHFHGGRLHGRVTTGGLDTREQRPAEMARAAGLVFQDPEAQLVAQGVVSEVAFGLESLATAAARIEPQAEEALMAAGASHLAERPTAGLSGGEQQRVAIAAVLAMGQPLLLLDEPTSQLDPVAAEELLGLVTRINRDRGVTTVLAEHRTGRLFGEADRVVVMEAGRLVFSGTPAAAAARLATAAPWLLPPITQAFVAAGRPERPLTVRDALRLLDRDQGPPAVPGAAPDDAVALRRVWARRGDVDVLRDVSTGFAAGAVTAVMGENGAGKTTLALVAAGLLRPRRGTVRTTGACGYVSQNPAHHLLRETVAAEVGHGLELAGVPAAERRARLADELERFGLEALRDRHPHDISSGERQRLAIASVTVARPAAILLDEPTRGMDGLRKLALGELLRTLAADGAAVGLVTHDADFAAEACDLVTTMGRGRVLADRAPRDVLAQGTFFVSQVGLATGRARVAEAAALIRSTDQERVHA
jgi:energy-coupling factor transporter ATP-binding protein EcfA2